MGVLFDPGYAKYTSILSLNIAYIYNNINKFKNLGQRKTQFKMYYQKILNLVNNNVAFCLGSMLWAIYIKSLGDIEIINNPCLGDSFDEKEAVEELDYSIEYFEQLKKDAKFYLNLNYEVNPKYLKVLEVYRKFLILNEAFVNTKTTNDIKLPIELKNPNNIDEIYNKIQEVVRNGNLTDLFELYESVI